MSKTSTSAGYHITQISKGVLGEASKVLEEALELQDAVDQKVQIMALVELSDLVGAMDAYLKKHHPSTTWDDLFAMSRVTQRAFASGQRQSSPCCASSPPVKSKTKQKSKHKKNKKT